MILPHSRNGESILMSWAVLRAVPSNGMYENLIISAGKRRTYGCDISFWISKGR